MQLNYWHFLYIEYSRKAERSEMSFIHVVGCVTTELELKVSLKGTPYVRFSLEERTGNAPAQLFQVWAYGWEAEHLVKVRKKLRTPVNRIVGQKAKLDLHVKVAKDWQSDPKKLERLGF